MKRKDEVRTVRETYLHMLQKDARTNDIYARGYALTPWGIVGIYYQWGNDPYTQLLFVHNHQEYARRVSARYSDRYLVTLCNRFAREISEGQTS